jgi:hypothetical protein
MMTEAGVTEGELVNASTAENSEQNRPFGRSRRRWHYVNELLELGKRM